MTFKDLVAKYSNSYISHISKHPVVHLQYIQYLFVKCTSVKLGGESEGVNEIHTVVNV